MVIKDKNNFCRLTWFTYVHAQVVNANHGAFEDVYFSGIYAIENLSNLSMIIVVTMVFMVWMNHQDMLLSNKLHILLVIMTTVAMVTMATMTMSNFWPQNYIFGLGTIASKEWNEIFSPIYVHICVLNTVCQDTLGVFQFNPLLRKYWRLTLRIFTKMQKICQLI